MNIVLLAAGKSSRIYKIIKKHKCLLKIKKRSLIENIIINAKKNKINKITVITGYKHKDLESELNFIKKIKFIYNKFFNKYEMVYSILLALKKINDDIIISYSDIFYDFKIINKIIKIKSKNIIIPIKTDWYKVWKKRKKSIFKDAETLKLKKNYITEIGKKIKKLSNIDGQFMGILFIPKCERLKLIKFIENNKLMYNQTTYLLNELISNGVKIRALKTKASWYEFDDYQDYKNFK